MARRKKAKKAEEVSLDGYIPANAVIDTKKSQESIGISRVPAPFNAVQVAGVTEIVGSSHTKSGSIYQVYNPRTDEIITTAGGGVQYNSNASTSTTYIQFDFGIISTFLNVTAIVQIDGGFDISGQISNDGQSWSDWFSQPSQGVGNRTYEFFSALASFRYARFVLTGGGASSRGNLKAFIAIPLS